MNGADFLATSVPAVPLWESRGFWDGALIGLGVGAVVMLIAIWVIETWG